MLGFVVFLFSFPIYRPFPFWPHWSIAEVFFLWFMLVAPIAIAISIVIFLKRRRAGRIAPLTKVLVWATLTVSLLVNGFMLLGLWAAFYY